MRTTLIVGVILAGLSWLTLFAAGVIVNSKYYRDNLSNVHTLSLTVIAKNLPMVLLSYTLTNTLFLCCFAAFLGAVGRRALISGEEVPESYRLNRSHYTAAILRGFFIYIALVSGALVTNAVSLDTTPQDYQHLAGVASLLSFMLGHDAYLFAKILTRLSGYADSIEIKKTQMTGGAEGTLQQETTTIAPTSVSSEHHA